MHSSPVLFAPEFRASRRRPGGDESAPLDLAEVFPDYHAQDRVAIVAPTWEDSFLANAAGVCALTALFYDAQRATRRPFYTYPSHYLLLCHGAEGLPTRQGVRPLSPEKAGYPWGSLDVWPETQWLAVPRDTSALLRTIFAQHIHRLLWPESLPIEFSGPPLPGYMRLIIGSRLKSVHYYDAAEPDLRIEASARAHAILDHAPRLFAGDFAPPRESRYRTVAPADFMARVAAGFGPAPAAAED
ncbi:MAG: hypothetical protein JNG83_09465 [Opitutaceae bacterium]|nr:hypothetical protein [Opitutaceae bacterium]